MLLPVGECTFRIKCLPKERTGICSAVIGMRFRFGSDHKQQK